MSKVLEYAELSTSIYSSFQPLSGNSRTNLLATVALYQTPVVLTSGAFPTPTPTVTYAVGRCLQSRDPLRP